MIQRRRAALMNNAAYPNEWNKLSRYYFSCQRIGAATYQATSERWLYSLRGHAACVAMQPTSLPACVAAALMIPDASLKRL